MDYLLEIEAEVLPKSPEGRAVRYTLKNWMALTRFCDDGDLEIDNNATERAIRSVAVGRNNWVFFGSDEGGKRLRCCGVSWRPVNGLESIPSLAQGRPVPDRHPSHYPAQRLIAAQLGAAQA